MHISKLCAAYLHTYFGIFSAHKSDAISGDEQIHVTDETAEQVNCLPQVRRLISGGRDFSFCHQVQAGCLVEALNRPADDPPLFPARDRICLFVPPHPCRPHGIAPDVQGQS
jgi:hypothetical protein